MATIPSNNGETLRGTLGNDIIDALGGNDTIFGNGGNDRLSGGQGNDSIVGDAGNDIIVGGQGNDTLIGAGGNDIYFFDAGDGADDIPRFKRTDSSWINTVAFGTGISPNDVVIQRGEQTLAGEWKQGGGYWLKIFYGAADTVTVDGFFNFGNPDDPVNPVQRISFANGEAWALEAIVTKAMTGNGADNPLFGTIRDDIITGNGGNDTIDGGRGNDRYIFGVGDGQDTINRSDESDAKESNVLALKNGILPADIALVRTPLNDLAVYTSGSDYATAKHFFYTGTVYPLNPVQNIEFSNGETWNSQKIAANIITGNVIAGTAGNDKLTSTKSGDHLFGGLGNDTYTVNDSRDAVTETSSLASEFDTVNSTVSFTLGKNIENLTLLGKAAINGTGNGLANFILGNEAANILDGQSGADILIGGKGNDTYVIDHLGDVVFESASEGTDTVKSSISYKLGENIEKLELTGNGAINGTGNQLANIISGNGFDNLLDGDTGTDTVSYANAAAAVNVSLQSQGTAQNTGSAGFDTLKNFENLTGSGFDDTLTGNSGANVLDGGKGADRMSGGTGSDTYIVDNSGDRMTELAGGGTDRVLSSVSFTLPQFEQVENLSLTGTAAINGGGNSLANRLAGNGAANVLAGHGGNDVLTGGAGADVFAFDTALGSLNVDHILDFNGAADQLRLDDAIFARFAGKAAVAAGNFAANTGGVAQDTNDYLLYDTSAGKLYYDTDGSGAAAKVLFVQLDNAAALDAGDFFVI